MKPKVENSNKIFLREYYIPCRVDVFKLKTPFTVGDSARGYAIALEFSFVPEYWLLGELVYVVVELPPKLWRVNGRGKTIYQKVIKVRDLDSYIKDMGSRDTTRVICYGNTMTIIKYYLQYNARFIAYKDSKFNKKYFPEFKWP